MADVLQPGRQVVKDLQILRHAFRQRNEQVEGDLVADGVLRRGDGLGDGRRGKGDILCAAVGVIVHATAAVALTIRCAGSAGGRRAGGVRRSARAGQAAARAAGGVRDVHAGRGRADHGCGQIHHHFFARVQAGDIDLRCAAHADGGVVGHGLGGAPTGTGQGGRTVAAIGVNGDAGQVQVAADGIGKPQVEGRGRIAPVERIAVVGDADAVHHRVAGVGRGGDDVLVYRDVRFGNVEGIGVGGLVGILIIAQIHFKIIMAGVTSIVTIKGSITWTRGRIIHHGVELDNDEFPVVIAVVVGEIAKFEVDVGTGVVSVIIRGQTV